MFGVQSGLRPSIIYSFLIIFLLLQGGAISLSSLDRVEVESSAFYVNTASLAIVRVLALIYCRLLLSPLRAYSRDGV